MVVWLAGVDAQFVEAESIELIRIGVVSFVPQQWSLEGLNLVPAGNPEAVFEREIFDDLTSIGTYIISRKSQSFTVKESKCSSGASHTKVQGIVTLNLLDKAVELLH